MFLLYKGKSQLTHFRFGASMFFLTRRSVIAGASVSAATCLAGCASTNPNPSLNAAAMRLPPLPPWRMPSSRNYNAVYAGLRTASSLSPPSICRKSIRRFSARTSPTLPRKRRGRSWSIPPITISTMWKMVAGPPAMALESGAMASAGLGRRRSRASRNGPIGIRPRKCSTAGRTS